MAKKFRDLVAQMPEGRQARIAAKTRQLTDKIPLQELGRALELTQQQVAASLGINQVAVSKMEGQTDMYVSTLRRFVGSDSEWPSAGELLFASRRRDDAISHRSDRGTVAGFFRTAISRGLRSSSAMSIVRVKENQFYQLVD